MFSHTGPRLAIDIGGTFTDTVLVATDGAIAATAKTPTTPANPALGAGMPVTLKYIFAFYII